MEEIKTKFLLAEYTKLNKQIEKLLDETNNMAKYATIGTVTIWSWFATNIHEHSSFPLWLPAGFCILLAVRSWSLTDLIIETGAFVAGIEKSLGISDELGWEQNVKKQRLKGYSSKRFVSAAIFWITLIAATIIVPVLFAYDKIK